MQESAVERWSLEYLRDYVGATNDFAVRASTTDFLYCEDDKANLGAYDTHYHVKINTQKFPAFYEEFVKRVTDTGRTPFQVSQWLPRLLDTHAVAAHCVCGVV